MKMKKAAISEPPAPAPHQRIVKILGKPIPLNASGKGRFYTVIPTELTPDEQQEHDTTGAWPFRFSEHLPEHLPFLDFLVEQGVAEWKRMLRDTEAANDGVPGGVNGGER